MTERVNAVFLVSVYLLVAVAGGILATYESASISIGAFTPVVALAAFILTELQQWRGLPPTLAALFGFVFAFTCIMEVVNGGIDARLLALGHLMVYLTWIVLLLRKKTREYWWLTTFSILQVAIAALLTESVTFAPMLLGFMLLAIWTLCVFSLREAEQRFASAKRLIERDPNLTEGSSRSQSTSIRGKQLHRLPRPSACPPSIVRGTIHRTPDEQWVNRRFVAGVFCLATLSMLVGSAFFALIPRVWVGEGYVYGGEQDNPLPARTGFTEEVQLGDIGQILESNEDVFEVRFYNNDNGREVNPLDYAIRMGMDGGEPLFRGSVMTVYDEGRWVSISKRITSPPSVRLQPPTQGEVRQEYVLRPTGTPILFAMYPEVFCRLPEHDSLPRRHSLTGMLYCPTSISTKEPLRYTVISPPSIEAWRVPMYISQNEYWRSRSLPEDRLERLIEFAREKSGYNEIPRPSQREMAMRLKRILKDSNMFSYTLDASIQDATIDPVEDFLFNRKSGHCEYFASALALMLRAVDIPSRLISGFKGADKNRYSGAYVVKQRHAHAWVEALIEGRWITLDPTVETRSESVQAIATQESSASEIQEFVKAYWSRNVVRLSLLQQQSSIYTPILDAISNVGQWLSIDNDSRFSRFMFGVYRFLLSPREWLSWRGSAVAFVIMICGAAFYYAGGTIRKWLQALWRRTGLQSGRLGATVAFYERFRTLVAAQGLNRGRAETHREFAKSVDDEFQQVVAGTSVQGVPDTVTELFYRVRFGAGHLDREEEHQVDSLLGALAEQFRKTNGRGRNGSHRQPHKNSTNP